MAEYKGYVTAGKSPASLVNTYGSKALLLHVHDQDFNHVRAPPPTPTPQTSLQSSTSVFLSLLVVHDLISFSTHCQGFNPMIYFTFSPASNHTGIYQVTQEGLLIARTNQLKAKDKHSLEVSISEMLLVLHHLFFNS